MRFSVKPGRRRLERVTINLAAMIDVTFLLLFFFMVASALDQRESRLSAAVKTQGDGPAAAADFQTQTIQVRVLDGRPRYQLGERILNDRIELAAVLQPLRKDVGLFIEVGDGVPVGFAVAAIQVASDAGFTQVTYVPGQ
jgi:biopolymer transport protein ExbD